MYKEVVMYKNERCIIIDESGNLGKKGRYFVIACIDTKNAKSLHNIMKRKLKEAKNIFPKLGNTHAHEIKAAEAYPCVKYHILECICKKDLTVSCIVADLKHIKPKLLEDKNILYNYLLKLLLDNILSEDDNYTTVNIICDNKTTKIASGNSFKDYISIHLFYERHLDFDVNIVYLDSDAGNAFIVQAADYVANSVYNKYEFNIDTYFDVIKEKINVIEKFPKELFSK